MLWYAGMQVRMNIQISAEITVYRTSVCQFEPRQDDPRSGQGPLPNKCHGGVERLRAYVEMCAGRMVHATLPRQHMLYCLPVECHKKVCVQAFNLSFFFPVVQVAHTAPPASSLATQPAK